MTFLDSAKAWFRRALLGGLSGGVIAVTWINSTNFKLEETSRHITSLKEAQAQQRLERESLALDITTQIGAMEVRLSDKISKSNAELGARIYHLEKTVQDKIGPK